MAAPPVSRSRTPRRPVRWRRLAASPLAAAVLLTLLLALPPALAAAQAPAAPGIVLASAAAGELASAGDDGPPASAGGDRPAVTAAADRVGLATLLADARARDPAMRLAAAGRAIAQARVDQSRSRLWPVAGVAVTAGQADDTDFGLSVRRRLERSDLTLRWNLYNGGADRAELQATRWELQAAGEDLEQALELYTEKVANAFLQVQHLQALLPEWVQRVHAHKRWSELARQQMQAGRLSAADWEQVRATLDEARHVYHQGHAELQGALGQLAALTGQPVRSVQPEVLPVWAPAGRAGPPTAALRVALARAEAARERLLHVAQLASPRVDLDARRRLHDRTDPQPTSAQRESWQIGVRWEVPLGGETLARQRELQARADAAQAEVDRLQQAVQAEHAALLPQWQDGRRAVADLDEQVRRFPGVLQAHQAQYEAGRRSVQHLMQLEDQRVHLAQRAAQARLRADQLQLRLMALAGQLARHYGLLPAAP